jgi:hypothetical protein
MCVRVRVCVCVILKDSQKLIQFIQFGDENLHVLRTNQNSV